MNNSDRTRTELRGQFLHQNGWADAEIEALPADMSFRRYFRLQDGTRHALLMDSPPDKEDIRPYVKIARHLGELGLSAPEITALDEDSGFAVIEDFGNDTYNRLIAGGASEWPLYELAIDTLAAMHNHPNVINVDVPTYDIDKLIHEVVELTDWYYPALTGAALPTSARARYVEAWDTVFESLPTPPESLVLRDYHVDNLMILDGRDGVAKCGLLDFQDAVIGHPAYDLTSLLEDARRDISDDLRSAMRKRYAQQTPSTAGDDFDDWYAVLSAQRHAKIAGRFTRFILRDDNGKYLCHIPRVMGLLNRSLSMPVLKPVKHWFDEYWPDPEAPLPDFDPVEIRRLIAPEALIPVRP